MSFVRGQSFGSDTSSASRWRAVRFLLRVKNFLLSDLDGVQHVDRIQMEHERAYIDGSFADQDLQPGFSPYDDYHTIDWVQDFAKDRNRHRDKRRKEAETCPGKLRKAFDACSAWLCVSIVGILCGCVAAVIDIGTSWLSDMKDGSCLTAFWLNKEQCCWFSNSSEFEGDDCDEWHTWAKIFGYNEKISGNVYAIQYALHIAWALLFSIVAVLLVRTFAPFAVGGGIPEIKTVLSGFIIRGLLGKWTLIIKTFGVMLAVAAGLVLGKEGPLVHIACCIGNIVTYFFPKYGKNEAKKREILSAAAAAGVSVAFGAPIGGVLFSLEEVSYYFPLKTLWRTFFCALVASFVLSSINPFGNDHMIVFYVDYDTPWVFVELIPFAFLGILGGFFGALFIYANIFWCKLRKTSKLGRYPITEVVGITLITALLSFPNEYTRLDTSELIARLVRNCGVADVTELCDYEYDNDSKLSAGPGISNAMWKLALAFLFKFVMLIVTVGIKLPAGLYIPSLAIGAIVGRMVGFGMEQLAHTYPNVEVFMGECGSKCITPGLYAMVGAVAFLGGITRMTVGLVVIMFEVTGGVRYIVPLMVAVMTSKWTGDALCEKGIFEALIDLNDYPFLDSKEEFRHTTLVSDVLRPRNRQPLVVLTQDSMTVSSIEDMLFQHTFNAFPVVASTESQYLIGLVLRRDLYLALTHAKRTRSEVKGNTEVTFADSPPLDAEGGPTAALQMARIVDVATITITDATPMEMVVDMFRKLGFRQLLVTHRGRLLGILTKKDILRHIKQLEAT